MPRIQSSTDLSNNYNDISMFCRESREPVFITKNGQGDLAVMSMEMFEMLSGKLELYSLLDEGRTAAKAGLKRSYVDVFDDIERELTGSEDEKI
ncbi:MAG: type II toxin-antitoxin system prevent-host-death family antitoxin [Oscillospiraceae bacterium]|nr:type II toxin-antitoxin system prevent-host-death family antitoxin [Oscillospiraceae bacterium]